MSWKITSNTHVLVMEIAKIQKKLAATGIISGLCLEYLSFIIPVVRFGITIIGMFGVAMGGLGTLGTVTMALTINVLSPIWDNVGAIAEMAQLDEWVPECADVLDAVGSSTTGMDFPSRQRLVSTSQGSALSPSVLKFMVPSLVVFHRSVMAYAIAALMMKSVSGQRHDEGVYRTVPFDHRRYEGI